MQKPFSTMNEGKNILPEQTTPILLGDTFFPLTEEETKSLLAHLGTPTNSDINTRSSKTISNTRHQTIFETLDAQKGNLVKVILDISFRAPTWQQFIDVTYNEGKDCDLKVILFDEHLDNNLWSSNKDAIAALTTRS